MTDLAELQQQFMHVLQGGESRQLSQLVMDQGNIDCQSRIDIYRHAYQQRLKISIETDHEILGLYLGDELFDKMVAGYIASYPSQQTSLRYFAEQLPRFLYEQEPFNQYPVISELARFERLLLTAFDAPDSEVTGAGVLNEIDYQDWPGLQFRLHPSVQC
nr:DNA-binding domain-containing protein [Gammaproteobacteria bacterium]